MGQAAKKLKKVEASKEQPQLELVATNSHNPFWQSSLFNEVYLQNDVPVKYKELWETDEAGPFYEFCNSFRNLCEELKDADLESWSERNTINRFVKPVLKMLGYQGTPTQEPWAEDEPFTVREGGENKTYKPDLIIVDDPKELKYIERKKGDEKLAEARSAVIVPIEVKYWGRIEDAGGEEDEDIRRADKREGTDFAKSLDFDEQCLKYMEILNKDYGILTDGKTWRLYSLDLSRDSYRRNFQFNLGHLMKHVNAGLDRDDRDYKTFLENAKYFFHLFGKQSLWSQNEERRFVDGLLEYSKKYVTKIEEDLKIRFVKAMSHACNGFLRSAESARESASLTVIRNVSESHLFNVFFIKHCESRNILPIKQSPEYRKISLSNTIDKLEHYSPEKEEDGLNLPSLKRMFSKDFTFVETGTEIYDRLLKLTQIVQDGSKGAHEGFEVKGFKESVFSKEECAFAKRHKLNNSEMARILFELGYCESDVVGRKYQQIPYNFFSPRQLGSIYESFLEFRIDKAETDLAFIKGQWQPANLKSDKIKSLDVPKVKKGHLFFSPDNADRKATGTYYTPDEIVQFVVTSTLEPIVRGKTAKQILTTKVIDPAMGSGHFLSGALNYMSKAYIAALDRESNDDLRIDLVDAKQEVLRSCIFGVDLNPRAVKLAKMSLWLESAKSNRILEPLDDQLKSGDSLVDDLEQYEFNFKWKKEFSGISFDAVVGNPPWISILGKFKVKSIELKYATHLIEKYELDTNRPNVYEAFVRKSLELISLTPNARYGVVLPEGLGINKQFLPLRKLILEKFDLEIVAYGFDFPGVIMDTGVFVVANSNSRKSFRGGIYPSFDQEVSFDVVRKDVLLTFNVDRNDSAATFNCETVPLGEGGICNSFTGFIAAKGALKESKESGLTAVIKGRDIHPFAKVSQHYVKLAKSSMIGGTQDLSILTSKPKVLLRKTGKELIAYLDRKGTPIEQSLYGLYEFGDLNPELLVLYFNSSAATNYYMSKLVTNRTATPHLKKMHLDQFPIPKKALLENKRELMALYEKIEEKGFTSDLKKKLDTLIDSIVSKKSNSRAA
ncbi:MAG: N-6 DNA methylase [Bdellovibrionales bacterium]|nr:N-6 DNA methylase [Bdellovibrionales bacterium]